MPEIPDEVYRACAEASWDAPGARNIWHPERRGTYVELMLKRPDWRALVESAYRAGREDAARDLRKIAVSSDEGNILRDLLDFAADVTEGMYTAAQVSLAAKVAAGNRTDESGADQPRTLHSSGEVQDNPEAQR